MARELEEEVGLRGGERLVAAVVDYDFGLRWITWRFYLEVSPDERASVMPASAEVLTIAWSDLDQASHTVRIVCDHVASGSAAPTTVWWRIAGA